MWLCDVEKAVKEVREVCPDYILTKIAPASWGIAFHTTHFSIVLWDEMKIVERYEDGRIKVLKTF